MTVVRTLWFALAVAAAALTAWFASSSVDVVSAVCSHSAFVSNPDDPGRFATCDASILTAVGVAQVGQLGALFVVPPLVVGFVMRWWVSWCMVAVMAGFAVLGLIGANGFWIGLTYVGVPVVMMAIAIGAAQIAAAARQESRKPRLADATLASFLDRDSAPH